MSNQRETLSVLCAEAQKLGLTTTEFWRQVHRNPLSEEDKVAAAENTLHDIRSGGTTCAKCGGSGEFIDLRGKNHGPCWMCKGKGYEDQKDMARNFGYRKNNPGRQERYVR